MAKQAKTSEVKPSYQFLEGMYSLERAALIQQAKNEFHFQKLATSYDAETTKIAATLVTGVQDLQPFQIEAAFKKAKECREVYEEIFQEENEKLIKEQKTKEDEE
jgi:hypothetical protein